MTERTKRRRSNIQTRSTAANTTISTEYASSSISSTRASLVPEELVDADSGTARSPIRSEQAPVPETSRMADTRSGTNSPSTSIQQPVDQVASDNVTSWILENYEWEADSNVPRSGIYEHYCHYCSSSHLKPVNAATFGKLIRTAFPGILTRRLGNRGQSKYQYCNIQRKEPQLDDPPMIASADPSETHFDETTVTTTRSHIDQMEPNTDNRRLLSDTSGFPSFQLPLPITSLATSSNALFSDISVPPLASRLASSDFGTLTRSSMHLPSVLTGRSHRQEDQDTNDQSAHFATQYNKHCRLIHSTICAGEFEKLESIYKDFYQNIPESHRSLLKTNPKLVDSIWHWDCVLYDSLILDLLPEVDTPTSDRMRVGIRHFIKALPNYLNHLLQDYPSKIRQNKVDVAGLFGCKLQRHLNLNQFAIAAANVLRQPDILNAMKLDWADLDIATVLDHVLWICDCRNEDMQQILGRDVTQLLMVGSTLDQWIAWEEKLIDKFVPRFPKINKIQDIDGYLTKAKQFILKWKVYTGLLMQQLYIKNVSSIGSFRSLQFFLDDLVLYHVEERVSIMNVDINKRLGHERPLPPSPSSVNLTLNQTNQA